MTQANIHTAFKESVFSSKHAPSNQFHEMWNNGMERPHFTSIYQYFEKLTQTEFIQLNEYARNNFIRQGVTFNVYSDKESGVERIFPFDLLPRVITQKEWDEVERGLIQRNHAINLFIHDLYNKKQILKDKIIPAELVFSSSFYCREMENFTPPGNIYTHITGTDLIRHSDGEYYILEDNLRCPSGVSYVLANREAMKRLFFDLFSQSNVNPVVDYPQQLLGILQSVAPKGIDNPTCVVLSPGMFNSAYFEHSFLAMNMGIQLVEGRDLFIDNNFVYMKTVYGPKRVDVIYRRIDDDFLDPLCFREDSYIGVPGLIGAYREGNVTIINAPGTGVADDKAVYAYIPDVIKYYLNEDPILNNVTTYRCEKKSECQHVLENMDKLVVKPVDESGGYGIMIGPHASKDEIEAYKKRIHQNPRKYIAQPVMNLSVHDTFIDDSASFEPRHIDLRTFCLHGHQRNYVLKGGLTRVALKKGSLIVNSSQGGGSKDTWVVR